MISKSYGRFWIWKLSGRLPWIHYTLNGISERFCRQFEVWVLCFLLLIIHPLIMESPNGVDIQSPIPWTPSLLLQVAISTVQGWGSVLSLIEPDFYLYIFMETHPGFEVLALCFLPLKAWEYWHFSNTLALLDFFIISLSFLCTCRVYGGLFELF